MPADERAAQLKTLATHIIHVARKLTLYRSSDPEFIPLTPLEGIFLEHVHRYPGISPSQLAADLGMRSGNTSDVLRALETKGMVVREADENDRRSVHVLPSALAERIIEKLQSEWVELLEPVVPRDGDLAAAARLLTELDAAWDRPYSQPD